MHQIHFHNITCSSDKEHVNICILEILRLRGCSSSHGCLFDCCWYLSIFLIYLFLSLSFFLLYLSLSLSLSFSKYLSLYLDLKFLEYIWKEKWVVDFILILYIFTNVLSNIAYLFKKLCFWWSLFLCSLMFVHILVIQYF